MDLQRTGYRYLLYHGMDNFALLVPITEEINTNHDSYTIPIYNEQAYEMAGGVYNFFSMCYFKSLTEKFEELQAHYAASFESILTELEPIREQYAQLIQKDSQIAPHALDDTEQMQSILAAYSLVGTAEPPVYSKAEFKEVKRSLRALIGFQNNSMQFYYENGYDHLPMPIVTAGEPDKFKLFNWGLIPFFEKDPQKAFGWQPKTLNCISENMYQTPAFRDAAKNAQRCLIPFTGFYEWRWLDDKGTVRIPYYITFRDGKPRSFAGLYSRWKNPETGQYMYTYTLLTTRANAILEYVHNSKSRMPVIIDKEHEKDWLNRDLSKDDVMDLCQPSQDPAMRAYTISKLLTTKNINPNVPQVREPVNYNVAVEAASRFLETGDKKKAIEVFKELTAQTIKMEHLEKVVREGIAPELSLS